MGRVRGGMPYALWYGSWYLVAFIAAWSGLGGVARGGVIPLAFGAVYLAWSVAVVVVAVRSHARSRRMHDAALRRELMALVRERAPVEGDGAWLNRDAHVAFSALVTGRGLFRRWTLARIDEDQVPAMADAMEGGRAAVTAEFFSVLRVHPAVQREFHGAIVTAGEDGKAAVEDGPHPRNDLRWWRLRLASFRAGHLFATADELRELIGQFKAAELIAPDS